MKRILLLTTGGTIAAQAGEQGLAPSLTGAQLLQTLPQLAELCQADIREVMNLDSTNIQPEEWQILAQSIYEALDIYDGFVIAHGTDTMAYSAAALSYMLRGLDKPVVFTGSQLPATAEGSDGPANLYGAFAVASSGRSGVYVVFAGKIIDGCRAVKVRAIDAEAFFSINAPLAGRVSNGLVEWLWPVPSPTGPRALDAYCQSRVLLLKLAPGMEADIVEAAIVLGYRGLVVEGYGAGNITNARRNIVASLAKAIRGGLAVAVTSQCLLDGIDMSLYEPGRAMLAAGAIPAYDMTTEALYVKLCWALGKTADLAEVRALMAHNIAGELGAIEN